MNNLSVNSKLLSNMVSQSALKFAYKLKISDCFHFAIKL